MLIKFNEEQTMIRDMVREFTKNEVEPRDYYQNGDVVTEGIATCMPPKA